MNLIGKEAHVSYDYGGSVATVFGTVTGCGSIPDTGPNPMVEVTDGEDIRYIPVKNIIHIHIGKLE